MLAVSILIREVKLCRDPPALCQGSPGRTLCTVGSRLRVHLRPDISARCGLRPQKSARGGRAPQTRCMVAPYCFCVEMNSFFLKGEGSGVCCIHHREILMRIAVSKVKREKRLDSEVE